MDSEDRCGRVLSLSLCAKAKVSLSNEMGEVDGNERGASGFVVELAVRSDGRRAGYLPEGDRSPSRDFRSPAHMRRSSSFPGSLNVYVYRSVREARKGAHVRCPRLRGLLAMTELSWRHRTSEDLPANMARWVLSGRHPCLKFAFIEGVFVNSTCFIYDNPQKRWRRCYICT